MTLRLFSSLVMVVSKHLRTTQEFIETIESAKDNEDALDSVVSFTIDSLEDFQTRQKRSVQSVIAGSAAEAYCAVKDEDKIKLHPCISYTANLILDSGDLIPTIIDAPHSLKSWREYKNGKKKHIHYVNGGAGNSMFVFRR